MLFPHSLQVLDSAILTTKSELKRVISLLTTCVLMSSSVYYTESYAMCLFSEVSLGKCLLSAQPKWLTVFCLPAPEKWYFNITILRWLKYGKGSECLDLGFSGFLARVNLQPTRN